jgi:Na+/melibiose symporter-like transporter
MTSRTSRSAPSEEKSLFVERVAAASPAVPRPLEPAAADVRTAAQSTAVMTGADGKLPLNIKLIYGAPRFTIRAAFIIIGIYANLYYINQGASINKMAFYIAAGRSFDVMTDPFMGWISDSTRTSWGRRKPYLLPGTILYSLVYVFFWSPWMTKIGRGDSSTCGHPGDPVQSGDINEWFGITYILFFCMDTFTSVPYYALGAELTDSAEERNSVYFWQNLYGQMGTLIGMAAPAMMLNIMGSEESAYTATALCFAAVHITGIALILKYIEERPLPTIAVAPFAVNFVRVLSNRAFQVSCTTHTTPAIIRHIIHHYALYTMHYAQYTIHSYAIHHTLIRYTLYTIHYAPYTAPAALLVL